MALSDKDILISPNRGQTAEPKIEFKGASSTLGPQTITLNVYPTDNGTLSFEGSAGQLFSLTNNLSGTIFSVNDVSGIPSIEVIDTGLVKLAQYSGNVVVGGASDLGQKLQVAGISALGTNLANYLTVTGAATGNAVGISTAGSDTNIGLTITTKGTGNIILDTGTSTGDVEIRPGSSNFRLYDDDSSHYYRFVTGNRTANYDVTLPAGNVTLTEGTSVVTSRTISTTSPITGGGDLSANRTFALAAAYGDTINPYGSKTANQFLAAPNGAAGVPTFRAIVAADVPTLNQNTTGTAANVTGTVAVANGGTGGTTQAAGRTGLGATTLGANLFTITNPGAITFPRFNADNTVSSLSAADFRTAIGAGTSSTTGTVTSVGGTGSVSGLTLTGTVTTSGNLTLGGTLSVAASNFSSQTANTFLSAPNGAAGVPTFRAIVAADVPTLNQNTTGSAATLTTTRTIWGQNFNGGANVSGALSGATTMSMSGQLTNTVAVGTAPFVITSTTRVSNLNVATAGVADTIAVANRTTNESGHAVFISTTATGNQAMYTNTNYRFNPSTGALSATDFNSTSDISLKTNISKLANAYDMIDSMNGYSFDWKDGTGSSYGIIAQEIETILPHAVRTMDDKKTVNYSALIPVLLEAVKELKTKVSSLTEELESLKHK